MDDTATAHQRASQRLARAEQARQRASQRLVHAEQARRAADAAWCTAAEAVATSALLIERTRARTAETRRSHLMLGS
ncbi:hypothetical protein [Nonomuraea gerenzanensis]|uniref:hypothetical protein n=1 Tax=Nonomuraea gerenzanensis TaxID=93944 RepID=UPI001CDA272F|nr:hypothetical protein [Nonomuraea gerenzanensis]UBU18665.1 hypothetical protein LCN96_27710 [Nonomuraea gerenzanensis]